MQPKLLSSRPTILWYRIPVHPLAGLDARLYTLARDELHYILDPADAHGPDYPSETFRVLKTKELKQHGEYLTRRLVLEAWDKEANSEKSDAATK